MNNVPKDVYVLGSGIVGFGKHLDKSLKDLGKEAIRLALAEANVEAEQIEAAYVANAMGGLITGQECVVGQIVLQAAGIHSIPVFNIENACASGSSALHLAVQNIRAGTRRIVLVVGVEKLYHPDRMVTSKALAAASDVELLPENVPASFFMEVYAEEVKRYMAMHRCDMVPFAQVAVKNRAHAAMNPHAQYRDPITVDEVLHAPVVVAPLTRLMCSPISDGAAALVLGTEEFLEPNAPKVKIAASQLVSGGGRENIVVRAAKLAYQEAGISPADVSVAEVHDATASAEVVLCEELGFCEAGEGYKWALEGHTAIGGKLPVNVSGGLLSRGHPIAVTGVAQIVELTDHLKERAGARQVTGARIGLAENAGGWVNRDAAACAVHILERTF